MFSRDRSPNRQAARRNASRRRLRAEVLESRRLLATLDVTTEVDAIDVDPGDGVCEIAGGGCSLRAAIQEANELANGGTPHRINVPAGIYELTIEGTDEGSANSGDLNIRNGMEIVGSGADQSIVDAMGIDRVFDIAVGSVLIEGVTIRGGVVEPEEDAFEFLGGGIRNEADLTLVDSRVTGNLAVGGAGVANYNGTLRIERSVITGNGGPTTTRGGGVLNHAYYDPADLEIIESTVSENEAGNGGGVLNYSFDGIASSDIRRSTISGNLSDTGGGVSNLSIASAYPDGTSSNFSIRNSTLSGNFATRSGGGARNQTNEGGSAILDILNSTITANTAETLVGGGIESVDSVAATTEIRSTIVSGNAAGQDGNDLFGATILGSFNLIGDADGHDLVNNEDNNIVGLDPLLAPLQDNGGPTLTHSLQTGSPAIDQGWNSLSLENDQRSSLFLRTVDDPTIANALDATDIGAVEIGQVAATFDYGDAPDGISVDGVPRLYPTLSQTDGARHRIDRFGPFLGQVRPDAEVEGQTSERANGDDLVGDDDEEAFSDGPYVLNPGEPIGNVSIQHDGAASGGILNVWLDLNLDGDWNDPNEHLMIDQAVPPGASQTSLSGITLPSDTSSGTSFFRARISTQSGLGPGGEAPNGEVEDIQVVIGDAPIETADLSLTQVVDNDNPELGEMITFTITVLNSGPDRATNVEVTNLLPDELFFEEATVSQGTYEFEETWFLDALEPGASAVLNITATVDSTDSFSHTAEVTHSDQFDPNSTPGNGISGEDDQATVTIGTCLSGGPLHVGQNRVYFSCASPGSFVGFVHGTQRGEKLIETYSVTVDIADAEGAAIGIADLQGIASVLIDITEDQLFDAVEETGSPLLVQAFEMFPRQTKSNTLSINTEVQFLRSRTVGDGADGLDARVISTLVDAAIERMSQLPLDAGDLETLRNAHFVVGDLPDDSIARVTGRTIVLDTDAAGHGWFIDPTPLDDSEYAWNASFQQLFAVDATAAVRIDLLTTVMHELGHLLDFPDVYDPSSVMHHQLDLGIRRTYREAPVRGFPLDVNDDGRVTALDALLVVNSLANPSDGIDRLVLDANGDNRVSARDALVIINHLWQESLEGEQFTLPIAPASGGAGENVVRVSGLQTFDSLHEEKDVGEGVAQEWNGSQEGQRSGDTPARSLETAERTDAAIADLERSLGDFPIDALLVTDLLK